MTPDSMPPSEGIKRRFGAGASGQQKRDTVAEPVSEKQRTLSEMRSALKGGGSEGLMKEQTERERLVELAIAKYKENTASGEPSRELNAAIMELDYVVNKIMEGDLHKILSDNVTKPDVLLAGEIKLKINYDDKRFDEVFEKLKKALSEENGGETPAP